MNGTSNSWTVEDSLDKFTTTRKADSWISSDSEESYYLEDLDESD